MSPPVGRRSSETAFWEKINVVVELEDTWDFEELSQGR